MIEVDYDDLVKLPYIPEVNDCHQLLRRYFAKLGIKSTDYAFPSNFWNHEDLYTKFYERENLTAIPIHKWRPQLHDIMVVRGSPLVNFATHAGVLVRPRLVLHHYTGRLSEVERFEGVWRSPLLVLRHNSIRMEEEPIEEIDILEVMPEHVRRRFLVGTEQPVRPEGE